ncbi:sensor histidine kinase [Algoriphagus winogradskyi]|uniref:histidine kinase n=1 Tax=Algoriphagus winogradskyi TaxID=237017 RepID=A0ABY1PK86_9BACT|nr:GAF domain-containing sensor histidine kinase [Algoriphagus winogradskyi]SMP36089.1 PAS domain-containing protein [Algoriphagus winogradskyi]
MASDKSQLTVFENEDLLFDLKTGSILKISDRLKLHFGEEFVCQVLNFKDYERITKSDENEIQKRNLELAGDQIFNYTIKQNGEKFYVNELFWVDHEKQSLHLVINFHNRQNIFELSYDTIMESLEKTEKPAIVFDIGLKRVIAVNSTLKLLLLQPFSELASGFVISDFFVNKEQYECIIDWIKNGTTSSSVFESHLYLEKKEGTWYEMTLYKTSPDDEVYIFCSLKSISVQKATEKQLQRTNELLSRVVEVQSHFLSKPVGANPYDLLLSNILSVIDAKLGFVGKVDLDTKGAQVLKIHAATDISGNGPEAYQLYHKYVKDDFLFRHFDNLFGACIVESKIILENNPPANPHTKGKKIPGHPTMENFLGVPIFKGKEVIGLIGLGNKKGGFTDQDITDLKPFISTYSVIIDAFKTEQDKIKFEKNSQVGAQILATVADHSPDVIVVLNNLSEFEFISPSVSQFFDKGTREEEMHRKIRVLLKKTLTPEFKISDGRYRSRLKLYFKDEGEYWVESNLNILNENNNQKIIAVIRDVSSQMNFEQRLIESLRKERQFNSFVSDFMNIVSHEFKTPLATIISSMELSKIYLENLADIPGAAKLQTHHRKIEVELDNLHKLISNSLDYERFVNNSPALKKEEVEFVSFVQEALAKHDYLGKVDFISEVENGVRMEWDNFLMHTSLINLVNNALKYGGVSKKPIVRLFQQDRMNGIEVKDFGIGILEEELPYVFTPFFRGSNVNGVEGTGFGLVAVKNFVEMHKGEIKIYSKPGKGTTVRLLFGI